MSQRLIASHSALLTKGLALKAGDWRNVDVSDEGSDDNKIIKRSESVTSMASLQNQFNIRRRSSSSLDSNSMVKSRSYPALLNAIRDDKESSISLLKQAQSNPTSSKDLAGVRAYATSNVNTTNCVGRSLSPASTFQLSQEALPLTIRSRPSMPNLSSLVEEKEAEGSFKTVSGRLQSFFDEITLKKVDPFKIHLANASDKSSFPDIYNEESVKPCIRSRLSMPNLSSLAEEEEDVLRKQCPVLGAKNSTIVVETFAKKKARQIDIRDISSSDLVSLKKDDPFMYYSIPAIRNASWQGKNVDLPLLQGSDLSLGDSSIYERKSRISFEPWNLTSPSDACVDDIDGYFIPSLGGAFFDFNMDDDAEDEDPIDDFLLMSLSRGILLSSGR